MFMFNLTIDILWVQNLRELGGNLSVVMELDV